MIENITLEMSLKPFKKLEVAYVEDVCEKIFIGWLPLIKHAKTISILLWVSDGSEILEYDRQMDREFEWGKYIGTAQNNLWLDDFDPDNEGLRLQTLLYTHVPPVFTYATLKMVVNTIKDVGGKILHGKAIRVGATFDPGPEFAKSDFKYNRHPEICQAFRGTFICCYETLKGDNHKYAGFADGIPDGTPFGTFFGRQCQIFLKDMGFDYIWFSNGFGFGKETWHTGGPIFEGDNFHGEDIQDTAKKIMSFWHHFRQECPDIPVETRGSNLSLGIDRSTEGLSIADLYNGGFKILPPPNSPWAALDGNFGLELGGHMTRIATLPDDKYMFRFYLHDPWWNNSPWYDRYEGHPHDIYLPMAVASIDGQGKIKKPTHLSFLTIDNSFGDMPDCCINEVIPHIMKAIKDAPDQPSPLVWIYPFDEFSGGSSSDMLAKMFHEDWLIFGAINNGLPLSTVVSTDNFVKTAHMYKECVLVSSVPLEDSLHERELFKHLESGGKALFYGGVEKASQRFLDHLNLKLVSPISGEMTVSTKPIDIEDATPLKLIHRDVICNGGINTSMSEIRDDAEPFATAHATMTEDERVIGVYGQNFAWVRGTCSSAFVKGRQLLAPDDRQEYFVGESLLRNGLHYLGYSIRFDKVRQSSKTPILMINRCDGAFMFSIYTPDTSTSIRLKFPQGAPILMGYETRVVDGYACLNLLRSYHGECRLFVEQDDGIVSCREQAPVSCKYRRRILIKGLKNATVRIYPELYCVNDIKVVVNGEKQTGSDDGVEERENAFYASEDFDGRWVGSYFEIKNVTGSVRFSMPMKQVLPVNKF